MGKGTAADFTAQGGRPTIVITPAGLASTTVNGVQTPNTPRGVHRMARRRGGDTWANLPGVGLVMGDPDVEWDSLPTQAGASYAYRLCRTEIGPNRTFCSLPASVTTPPTCPPRPQRVCKPCVARQR